MDWVKDIDTFYNFIGYVVLSAPDRFLWKILRDDEQMNLEKAFVELHRGIDLLDIRVADENQKQKLREMLDVSLAAYHAGDDVKGAHTLQDLEAEIFRNF